MRVRRCRRPPANLPQIDRRIEALRDERAALDGEIASATARRKFAERFAETSPTGLGEKGEARPLGEWRAGFAAVAEEIATADNAIRDAKIKQRDIDREIARLEAERNATPPKKLEVRIDLNADAAAPALLRVTYAVRGARWTPLYDARLDTGGKDRKPSLELVRRAEIVQTTGEDWADVALSVSTVRTAQRRQRARTAAADRALSATPRVRVPRRVEARAARRASCGRCGSVGRPSKPRRATRGSRPRSSRPRSMPAASRSCSGFPAGSPCRRGRAPRASASRPRTSRPN